jgi:hypothetical protein
MKGRLGTGDHLGVEQEDCEHWLGHHGEHVVVEAVHVAEPHVLGDPEPPDELHRLRSGGRRERGRAERTKRKGTRLPGQRRRCTWFMTSGLASRGSHRFPMATGTLEEREARVSAFSSDGGSGPVLG